MPLVRWACLYVALGFKRPMERERTRKISPDVLIKWSLAVESKNRSEKTHMLIEWFAAQQDIQKLQVRTTMKRETSTENTAVDGHGT